MDQISLIPNNLLTELKHIYERIRASQLDKNQLELEYIWLHPSITDISAPFYIDGLKKHNHSYIEYVVYKESSEQGKIKIRQRRNFYDIDGFELTNANLAEFIENSKWEEKHPLLDYCVENPHYKIITSIEKKNIYINKTEIYNKISMVFVNSIKINFENFLVDIKIKRGLGSCRQGHVTNFFSSINNVRHKYQVSVEIEYKGDFSKPFDSIKDEFSKIYTTVHQAPIDRVFFSSTFNPSFNTHLLESEKIFSREDFYKDYLVSKKIDGDAVVFLIKDNYLYISFNIREHGVWFSFRPNISIGAGEMYYGMGEFYKSNKTLFPFFLKHFQKTGEWVVIAPTKIKDRLAINHDRDANLNIVHKEFKEATSHIEFLDHIYKTSMETDYVSDGIILAQKNPQPNQCDYKLKSIKEADVLMKVKYTYSGKIDPRQMGTDGLSVRIDILTKEKNQKPYILDSFIQPIGQEFEFYPEICMVKHTTHTPHLTITVVPIMFIGEFNFETRKLVRIRPHKTDMFIKSSPENLYVGNSLQIVTACISSDTFKTDFLKIKTWNSDVSSRNIVPVSLSRFPEPDMGDRHRLNKQTLEYFSHNRLRSPLGYISNYIKTLLIGLYTNKITYNKNKRARVLDIDFGNGSDLSKYFYAGVSEVFATDPDSQAIKEAKSRYTELNKNEKSKYFSLLYSRDSIRNSKYIDTIRGMTNYLSFDVINWSFAIHFSWHPRHMLTVMYNLSMLSKPGTRIIVTTVDGTRLCGSLDSQNSRTFKIHPTEPKGYIKFTKTEDKIFEIEAPLTCSTVIQEYIVDVSELVKKFKEYGFIVIDHDNFLSTYVKNIPFLRVGSKLETRQSTHIFYKKQRNILMDLKHTDLGSLLDYYIYLVFVRQ